MPTRPLDPGELADIVLQAQEAFELLRGARIFVTGGTGFFGHWLLESLLHANQRLSLEVQATVLTRNVTAFVEKSPHIARNPAITLFAGDIRAFGFPAECHTHILHAATDSGRQQAESAPYALAESIIDGTRRVLQFARHTGATRLLYASSGAVYGRSTTLLHTPESFSGAPDPLLLQSSYDEGKRMAEHLCVAYAHGTPLEAVVARCFAFVGPHLPLDQHFAIGNFIRAGIHNQPIRINGDGSPRRSWLYMSDLAVWLWQLLARGQANRAYNVGSDAGYTIAEAARITAATLRPAEQGDSALPIEIAGEIRPDAPLNSYVPNVNRARAELGLQVTVPLEAALLRTAAWHGYTPAAIAEKNV